MRLAVVFILLLQSLAAFSQQQPIVRCGTHENLTRFQQIQKKAITEQQFEGWLQEKMVESAEVSGNQSTERVNTAYIIPVIFHIIHNGEASGLDQNLSAIKIQQQLDQLNADFGNRSGSIYGVAADVEIQFCAAFIDPLGNELAEPGIERINRTSKGWSQQSPFTNDFVSNTIMPSSIWNPYQYLNVWILDLQNILGQSTFPSASTLEGLEFIETDLNAGIMIDYATVGNVLNPGVLGTSAGLGRTLTHEVGHFFGLRHIWGDADCATDYCDDTPPQDRRTLGCPSSSRPNNCFPAGAKMFENYMDYTDDNCLNTFTADQKNRMQTVMLNSPRRKELVSSTVCISKAFNTIILETRQAERSIELNWKILREKENKGFFVEKSVDAINFKELGWIAAKSANSEENSYSFSDRFVQPDIIYYYRIRQVDLDNKEKLSATKDARVSTLESVEVIVTPNPANNIASIFISGSSTTADIELRSASGQLVKSWKNVNAFSDKFSFPVGGFSKGIYIISIRYAGGQITKKLLIR